MVKAILAISDNNVIGLNGSLPWHIKEDLQHFKKLTLGQHCICGYNTYLTLPALPNRYLWVVSRNLSPLSKFKVNTSIGTILQDVSSSIPLLIRSCAEFNREKQKRINTFLIGGASLLSSGWQYVDEIFLTRIHEEVQGDTFFEPDFSNFILTAEEKRVVFGKIMSKDSATPNLLGNQREIKITFQTYTRAKINDD